MKSLSPFLPASRNRRQTRPHILTLAAFAGPLALAGQARALTYTDATFANTTLADGTALELHNQADILAASPPQWISRQPTGVSQAETANSHWHIRQPFGNGTEVFASTAGTSPYANTAPTLRTTMSGLTPGETYEVSVYFWVAGNGAPVGNQEWDIKAGLDSASLTSIRHNTAGSVRLDTSGVVFANSVTVTEADRRLFRFVLGNAVAAPDGTIPVYVSPYPGNDDRTWYDGVGYASLAPPPPATWTGAGAQPLWSVGANWDAGQPPEAAEILLFGNAALTDSQNDLTADTSFGGLRFGADAVSYGITGNRFSLSGPILNQSLSTPTVHNPLLLTSDLDCNLVSGGLVLGGVLSGAHGVAKSGIGSLELSGTNTYTGVTTVQSGPVLVSGNQTAANGGWLVGPGTASATTVTWGADSVMAVSAAGTIRIGDNKGSLATTLTAQRLTVSGTVTNDGALYVGLQGTLELAGAAVWEQNGPLTVEGFTGWYAAMSVTGDSTFVHAGSTPVTLKSGTFQASRGRIGIQGGTFVTGQPISNGTPETLPGLVNLSADGILRLSADITDLTPGTDIVLTGGDGVIDTQAHNATVSTAVSGTGTLVKDGTGTLTLAAANTYTGGTTVRAGVLALAQAGLSDSGTVDLSAGAKLRLGFAGADAVGALILGGTAQGPGTYDHTSHPAFFEAGTGALTVRPGSFAEWAALHGLTGTADADFDGDGLADAVEYVLGTDPKSPGAPGARITREQGNVVFEFSRDDASETPDISLVAEVGDDLASWPMVLSIGADSASSGNGVTVAENGSAPDVIRITLPIGGSTGKFLRLRVVAGE